MQRIYNDKLSDLNLQYVYLFGRCLRSYSRMFQSHEPLSSVVTVGSNPALFVTAKVFQPSADCRVFFS